MRVTVIEKDGRKHTLDGVNHTIVDGRVFAAHYPSGSVSVFPLKAIDFIATLGDPA